MHFNEANVVPIVAGRVSCYQSSVMTTTPWSHFSRQRNPIVCQVVLFIAVAARGKFDNLLFDLTDLLSELLPAILLLKVLGF